MDSLGLVNANGRIYEPTIGRFMSVDPVYQAPTNTQSVNPYSYVMNNPLSLVDPSGYTADAACNTGQSGSTASCDPSNQEKEDPKPTSTGRLYKGHNDSGSMDHLAGTKLAAFDKAVQNRLSGATGVLDHGRAAVSFSNGGDGGQKTQDLDTSGHLVADIGKQSKVGNVTNAGDRGNAVADDGERMLEQASGMSKTQLDDIEAEQSQGQLLADNDHPLGYYLPNFEGGIANAITGFGDGAYKAMTLGIGDLSMIRNVAGIDGNVSYDSSAYTYGKFAGEADVGIAMLRAGGRGMRVDGPSAGLKYGNGRIGAIRRNEYGIRLDYHPLRPGGPPVLHINIGKGGESFHIPLYNPDWFGGGK